jgi:hypothetical protein
VTHLSTPPVHDSKTDLLDAARAVVKDRSERATQERSNRLQPAARKRVGALTLLSVIGLGLLVLRPEWLVGPKAVPAETPAVAEASLRLGLLRERQRIVDFVRLQGRLPASLAEAGVTLPGVGFEAEEAQGFRIFAQVGDSLLVLHSGDSMSSFLGSSLQDIKNRGRP